MTRFARKSIMKRLQAFLAGTCLCAAAPAQTWTPMGGGHPRSVDVARSGVFAVPASIAARGGVLRATLVGGGEGGSLSRSQCDDAAVQGGKGGDGGEVIEVDIPLQPGMCTAGLAVQIGGGGRGALRSGNTSTNGEAGGITSVSCAGSVVAQALGGGRRVDGVTASRAVHGGAGAVVMNTAEAASAPGFDQRTYGILPASDGRNGRAGFGSGGGGGGVSLATNGITTLADGVPARRATVRNAPLGRGGYGGGAGAGPAGFAAAAPVNAAENAAQYGAGGGGAAALCLGGSSGVRDAGHGFSGVVRFQWHE
jgi:hypothetical protein